MFRLVFCAAVLSCFSISDAKAQNFFGRSCFDGSFFTNVRNVVQTRQVVRRTFANNVVSQPVVCRKVVSQPVVCRKVVSQPVVYRVVTMQPSVATVVYEPMPTEDCCGSVGSYPMQSSDVEVNSVESAPSVMSVESESVEVSPAPVPENLPEAPESLL